MLTTIECCASLSVRLLLVVVTCNVIAGGDLYTLPSVGDL